MLRNPPSEETDQCVSEGVREHTGSMTGKQVARPCIDPQAFEGPNRAPLDGGAPHPSVPSPVQPSLPRLSGRELALRKVSVQTASSALASTTASILVFLHHTG